MACLRVLLLVSLAVFTSASLEVSDPVLKEILSILEVEHWYREQVNGTIKHEPWCFCGKEMWTDNFKKDFWQTLDCGFEARLNFTSEKVNNTGTFVEEQWKKLVCLYGCIFQKLNLLTEDGAFDKSAVKETFKDHIFKEDALKETADKVLDKCLSTGTDQKLLLDVALSAGAGTTCNKEPLKLMFCLLVEMLNGCPESLKKPDVYFCKMVNDTLNK